VRPTLEFNELVRLSSRVSSISKLADELSAHDQDLINSYIAELEQIQEQVQISLKNRRMNKFFVIQGGVR
jgi:RNase P subunit RPR2